FPKPEGVGSEAADVLIRLVDTCRRYGVNLGEEFQRKLHYNSLRPHRHGGKNLWPTPTSASSGSTPASPRPGLSPSSPPKGRPARACTRSSAEARRVSR